MLVHRFDKTIGAAVRELVGMKEIPTHARPVDGFHTCVAQGGVNAVWLAGFLANLAFEIVSIHQHSSCLSPLVGFQGSHGSTRTIGIMFRKVARGRVDSTG